MLPAAVGVHSVAPAGEGANRQAIPLFDLLVGLSCPLTWSSSENGRGPELNSSVCMTRACS